VTWEAAEIVETLKKCLEADPNDRWARIGMAEGLRDLGRFDEADAALAPLPESDPVARAGRVRIALDRGDAQTANSLLEAGPTNDVELALLRGRFALARGDGPEAVRQFRIAHDLNPNLREAVLGLGQALKNTGDLAGAAPFTEEARKHERLGSLVQKAAAEKNRDDPALIRDLGAACADLGRLPEARAWYSLAVNRDPLDTKAQAGLAQVDARLKSVR
jgi:Flp pilus assembly protein TadD